jgi:peptidoglycan/LPS O-acetylase OafA/YrhL
LAELAIPSGGRRLDGLQVARGVAAFLVLAAHAELISGVYFGTAKPSRPPLGIRGVDLFFVLSGFIMWWVHERDFGQRGRIGAYAAKRFFRIYLPYWPALAIFLAGLVLIPTTGEPWMRSPEAIAAALLLLPHPEGSVLAVAWTLCYEVTFYAVFGLIIISKRLGLSVFAGWLAASMLFQSHEAFPWSFLTAPYPVHFALGMLTAFALRRWDVRHPLLLVAGGALAFFAIWWWEPMFSETHFHWLYAAASGVMVLGLAAATLNWPSPLKLLGDASYSIYLVHYPLLVAAVMLLPATPFNPILAPALALAGGLLFYVVVERPAVKIGQAFARRIGGDKPAALA